MNTQQKATKRKAESGNDENEGKSELDVRPDVPCALDPMLLLGRGDEGGEGEPTGGCFRYFVSSYNLVRYGHCKLQREKERGTETEREVQDRG